MRYYVDTSAAAKLVLAESGSAAFFKWCRKKGRALVSSDVLRVELMRSTRKAAPTLMTTARGVIDAILLVPISTAIVERAGILDPPGLRSLDAIHLATVLELGDAVSGIVTYDIAQAAAATALGLSVTTPR